METNKLLSSLSYLSIFFAGFIFPLIVLFVTKDKEVKGHAVKALVSHIIPIVGVPFIFLSIILDFNVLSEGSGIPFFMLGGIGLYMLMVIIITIWNVYKGVKVLL
ncbi:DUF4870 domain-containing protein [Bacillus sp. 2205SS5-2]|uniref:DUF4870 domain-containing protein n=1 Tax=Bacillus sp. 2205SS5-2 TaxID=3109031 RepID=UPI003006A330